MRPLSRLLLVLIGLAVPFATATALSVTGLRAEFIDNQVRVSWDAPADPSDVESYRVYYSRTSILQNDGEYDDFETVDGNETTVTLQDVPQGDELYVSVLAVNRDGEEMDTFVEEVGVTLSNVAPQPAPPTPTPTPVPAPVPQPIAEPTSFRLLEARGTSPTQVTLTFSHRVKVPPAQAAGAFTIVDQNGTALGLSRLAVLDRTVTITTLAQRGVQYEVRVSDVIFGQDQNGGRLSLDMSGAIATFIGIGDPTPVPVPAPTPSPVPADASLPDVIGLALRVATEPGGARSVIASWTRSTDPRIASYRITQTSAGVAHGEDSVPATSDGARFRNVPAGTFGILVQSVSLDGSVSTGAHASLTLGGTPGSGGLTGSGPGLVVVMMGTGAVVGWRRMRTKKYL